MNGNNLLVDTNILIYLLNGDETLEAILEERSIVISFITKIELLSFKKLDKKEKQLIEDILFNTTIVHSYDFIVDRATYFRQTYNSKIPDAVIAASSSHLNLPLLTADQKLGKIQELKVIQYSI